MTAIGPRADYDEKDGLLRLSGQGFYLVIEIPRESLLTLSGVGGASWDERQSIRAGTALGKPVFWCRSDDDPTAVTAMVGDDDETWDLAVEIPAAVLLGVLSPI